MGSNSKLCACGHGRKSHTKRANGSRGPCTKTKDKKQIPDPDNREATITVWIPCDCPGYLNQHYIANYTTGARP